MSACVCGGTGTTWPSEREAAICPTCRGLGFKITAEDPTPTELEQLATWLEANGSITARKSDCVRRATAFVLKRLAARAKRIQAAQESSVKCLQTLTADIQTTTIKTPG